MIWEWRQLGIGEVDLAETLDGGQAFRWHEIDGGEYEGVIGSDIVRLRNCDGELEVGALDGTCLSAICDSARDYVASGLDPREMFDQFGDEPWATDESRSRNPLRVLRQDPWECLAAFVCAQNTNMVRIKQLVAALARFGKPFGREGELHRFPSADVVAGIGEQRFRDLRFGYRAPYLHGVAQIVAADPEWLHGLRTVGYDDAKRELLELPGVGPKVADCVLAYSLDKGDAFPIDVHVMRAMQRLYGMHEDSKIDAVASWARDRFGPWSSLVQLYVFRDEVKRFQASRRGDR